MGILHLGHMGTSCCNPFVSVVFWEEVYSFPCFNAFSIFSNFGKGITLFIAEPHKG